MALVEDLQRVAGMGRPPRSNVVSSTSVRVNSTGSGPWSGSTVDQRMVLAPEATRAKKNCSAATGESHSSWLGGMSRSLVRPNWVETSLMTPLPKKVQVVVMAVPASFWMDSARTGWPSFPSTNRLVTCMETLCAPRRISILLSCSVCHPSGTSFRVS